MTAQLSPCPIFQGIGPNGVAVGGLLFTYQAGTSIPQATYVDSSQVTPNTNPVVLNSLGQANVWLDPTKAYKFVLQDATGNQIWAVDNIQGVLGSVSQNILPSVNNIYNIGSPALTFANGYFGTALYVNGVAVPTYAQTPAEITAGVTPSNYLYAPLDPRRYGATGNGIADDTVPVQTAFTVAAVLGGVVKINAGLTFLCTANINVQCATTGFGVAPFAPDLEGSGWTNWGIIFSGSAVTNGLTYTGGAGAGWVGSIRNLAIRCIGGATQAITFTNCTKPFVWQCFIYGAIRGIYASVCIMPVIEQCLFSNCGNSTFYTAEFDQCTTVGWKHNYISGGAVGSIGGVAIDRASQAVIEGGAIESCGTPIAISCKISTANGCVGVTVRSVDLENPGNNNRYIDIGSALTGGGVVSGLVLDGWTGFSSGTTIQPSAVRVQNTVGAELRLAQFALLGTPTASYELAGTLNVGVHILAHRNQYGAAYPWVTVNGTMVKAAGPSYDWVLGDSPKGLAAVVNNLTGTNPSILILAAQGGYYAVCGMTNAGATTVATLTGGESGMQILIIANDNNSTLTFGLGAGQFATLTGANLALAANKSYAFVSNGTCWIQH